MIGNCAECDSQHICAKKGVSCKKIDKEEILKEYTDEDIRIMKAAAYVEATFYMKYTRVQETAEFARQMGYKRLGIAFCTGVQDEIALLTKYFKKEGFEVVSICCKNCGIRKEVLGLKRAHPERDVECMCNPKIQAMFLNDAGVELFISAGLCVGHDALFNKYCNGPVTNLIAKDRVLGNNPVAALYASYWKKKLGIYEEK